VVTDLFSYEKRKHAKLSDGEEKNKLSNTLCGKNDTQIRRSHRGRHREYVEWISQARQWASGGRVWKQSRMKE
jgi:hypothetical protein